MEFRLPELGEGVHEGELVKWRVKPGDSIADDQALCEVMTDKATMEIPSPFAGTVTTLHAKEGEIIKVNQLLITADAKAGAKVSATQSSAATPATATVPTKAAAASIAPTPTTPARNSNNVLASPATRKAAREKGIDLNTVQPSGPHGRVLLQDLEKNFTTGPKRAISTREERIAFRGLRKKIAEKMRLSKDKAAHFTYVEEADASELVKIRAALKLTAEKQGVKLTYLPFVLKAMAMALKKHPTLNSTLDEATQEIVIKHFYNIAISIQTEEGLTAPVVKHVEAKSILEIARDVQDLVTRARAKKLQLEDFNGSTITLTNAGSIGGLFATPVINFPEVAILGFNKISRKPVVKTINGAEKIVIRDWTYFSISLDHRIVDGADGAEFMKTFINYIENPVLLFVEDL